MNARGQAMAIQSNFSMPIGDSTQPSPKLANRPSYWEKFRETKAYDLAMATPLILWYGSSAVQQLPSISQKIANAKAADIDLHFIVSALAQLGAFVLVIAILIFVLLRGPAKAKAKGLTASIIAIAGTSFAVAVTWLPQIELGFTMSVISLLLIVIGVTFSTYTMLFLGRSFSIMAQARKLVTTGPYSLVRHPLYLGEGMAILGMMLQYLSPLAVAIVGMQFAFQLQRMQNEERVLAAQFSEYPDYMARTARIIPGVY
jgi:protein-S-isoprenylcysteine O-methyltransferase Ste14